MRAPFLWAQVQNSTYIRCVTTEVGSDMKASMNVSTWVHGRGLARSTANSFKWDLVVDSVSANNGSLLGGGRVVLRGNGFAFRHDTYGTAVLAGSTQGAYMGSSLVDVRVTFCGESGGSKCTLFEGHWVGGFPCRVTASTPTEITCVPSDPTKGFSVSSFLKPRSMEYTIKVVVGINGSPCRARRTPYTKASLYLNRWRENTVYP